MKFCERTRVNDFVPINRQLNKTWLIWRYRESNGFTLFGEINCLVIKVLLIFSFFVGLKMQIKLSLKPFKCTIHLLWPGPYGGTTWTDCLYWRGNSPSFFQKCIFFHDKVRMSGTSVLKTVKVSFNWKHQFRHFNHIVSVAQRINISFLRILDSYLVKDWLTHGEQRQLLG